MAVKQQSKNGIIIGTITQGESEPGCNGNEGVHTPQSFRTEASPSAGLGSCQGHSLFEDGMISLGIDAVSVFNDSSRLGLGKKGEKDWGWKKW